MDIYSWNRRIPRCRKNRPRSCDGSQDASERVDLENIERLAEPSKNSLVCAQISTVQEKKKVQNNPKITFQTDRDWYLA